MSAALYNTEILRLAAAIPHDAALPEPQGRAERRSPICGSRVAVSVRLDHAGRIAALGQEVRACALGQASAALFGAHAIGRDRVELVAAREALTAFLAGGRDDPGAWPGLVIFVPARAYSARHPSIRLAFEAGVAAVEAALAAAREAA